MALVPPRVAMGSLHCQQNLRGLSSVTEESLCPWQSV